MILRQRLAESLVWAREHEFDVSPAWRWARARPEMIILALGALLRTLPYIDNRSMWLDELSLKGNLVDVPVFDLAGPLRYEQLAPFGFLIVQRTIVKLCGDSNFALRIVPMAAGLLALWLFWLVARRVLARRPALVALILFAFSEDLIYYTSEMKPYALDLAIGLAIVLGALSALGRPAGVRSLVGLTVAAALAPWCSFASTFVIAGCGAALVFDGLSARRYRSALLWALVGLVWLASFGASYRASRALLGRSDGMYRFWDFAFPSNHCTLDAPWSTALTTMRADTVQATGVLLEVFVNPLNLVGPYWPRAGVLVPLVLLQIGELVLARRSWADYLVLALPIGLAMAAAGAKLYPFHGRLVLELVPALYLLIAEGADWLGRRGPSRSRWLYKGFLVFLLAWPTYMGLQQALDYHPRSFSAHGDLRPNVFVE